MFTLANFYRSREWERFREQIIQERIQPDGFIYDEETGKPILKMYDLILHHKIELTDENVNDYNISLNSDNIMVVSFKTHNIIHDRLASTYRKREVFIVYGSPLSGKSTWVKDNMCEGDLIVDMDSIWQSISGLPRYLKPNRLKSMAFRVRDTMLDAVRYRFGKWNNAYIIGGYALQSERDRLANEMGARLVFIDTSREECLKRLDALPETDGRNRDEWREYIEQWWERYGPPVQGS